MDSERSVGETDALADDLFGDDDDVVTQRVPETYAVEKSSESGLDDDHEDQDEDEEMRAEKHALEYFEDEEGAAPEPIVEERTAWINVAQPAVRRTKPTLLARLPNFVRYRDQPFDASSWNGQQEEEFYRRGSASYAEFGDANARSILRTANTVRWRWRNTDQDRPTPESNARIVRWSDGSESLQLGTEFYDMTRHKEARANAQDGGKLPLTYLYVPHAKEGILQAEGAVRTSLSFKPNLHSETHNRLASALKHHRSARVVAGQEMFGAMDPEKEKERIERQLKDTEKKKRRELLKARRQTDDFDDDLDLDSRRQVARSSSRRRSHAFADWSDDDQDLARDQVRHLDYEDDEDDGFIVHDESDEDIAEGKAEAAASEDETELADRNIEEFERVRREKRDVENNRLKRHYSEEP
ncbi:Paf1 complex component [Malassezia yamatoensis]|uniref:Paf1 complex component n=1 Tax=Malassezia yamatoensis TaxID=253288 RepID=A0AAJ5YV23_9BASI|nr:Paf1 complex component [Malassezia yamatoensis]